MILFLYLNQFYKTEQGDGSSPNRNSCCIVSSRLNILLLCSHRTNRTANCKLKDGTPGEPCEDDYMLSTRVESISSIKFFNYLQLGDAVFYSQTYRGITRRNHHTVFFMFVKDVDSVMTCGAALAQMPKDETHFANTVSSIQSHCSHFQTKRGHFLQCLSQTDCHD